MSRWIAGGFLVAALLATPVASGDHPWELVWQVAQAEKGGNGKGGGRGGGNGADRGHGGHDHDHAGRGHAHGHDRDGGGQEGDDRDRHQPELGELVDRIRSGKAFGRERQDERVKSARERYNRAAVAIGPSVGQGSGRHEVDRGEITHRFSSAETDALIQHGWQGKATADDGFRNHGERVRTMVAIARNLGHGARVGSLQASFGTPQENGITALAHELADARAALAATPGDPEAATRVARLEAALDQAVRTAKPGNGPDDDWAVADLDVNDDGVVNRDDLAALEHGDAETDAAADQNADPDAS